MTAEDFVFTYETIVDPSLEIVSREGYQLITGYEVVDDKTVVFAFDEIYAPWQTLFGFVLPAHILEGEPFNTVWDDAISMGSGPFTFVEWVAEERITLAKREITGVRPRATCRPSMSCSSAARRCRWMPWETVRST